MTTDFIDPAVNVPNDFRALAGDRRLVCYVLEAIHAPASDLVPGSSDVCPPQRILRTLLLYCYAAGIYSSRDIEQAVAQDPTAKYICAGAFPDWNVVRHFRRQNAFLLRRDLIELFHILLREFGASSGLCEQNQSGNIDPVREADIRIRRAVQADSMAMDD